MTASRPSLSAPPSRFGVGNHTVLFLAALYALSWLEGLSAAMQFDSFDAITRLIGMANVGLWVGIDSRRLGRPVPRLTWDWIAIFAVVTLPGYVIYSRRWRGLGWLVLHGLASYFVTGLGFGTAYAFI